jgi:hypothetical protein
MSRRVWAVWLGLLFCAGMMCGCKRAKPSWPARVVDIQISSQIDGSATEHRAPTEMDSQSLLAAAMEGLKQADVSVALAPPERTPGDFVLQIELGLMYATPAKNKRALRVLTAGLLRLRKGLNVLSDDDPASMELTRLQHLSVAERDADPNTLSALVWRELAVRAVTDTAKSLGNQLHLNGASASELKRLVEDKKQDPGVRGVALRLLATRRSPGAQNLAMIVLKDRESPSALRDHAIGALIEIGDPKALRPLLDSTEFRDRTELGKVLEAAAALGGEEAQRYLEFVAQSHSDAQIRNEAKTALSHLLSRQSQNSGPMGAGGPGSAAHPATSPPSPKELLDAPRVE